MTQVQLGAGRRAAAVGALGLGVAAGAASITLLSQMMRSVLSVGGSCADGGPYVSAQPCPTGVGTSILLALVLGGVCLVGTLWGASVLRAPQPLGLGWPVLFLALGWNFLEFGAVSPPDGAGVDGSLLFCGVLFVLLALGPLLLAGISLRQQRPRPADPPPVVVEHPHLRPPDRPAPSGAVAAPEVDPGAEAMSLAGRLERLAALHASGELTDEEFRLAKTATLREEVR